MKDAMVSSHIRKINKLIFNFFFGDDKNATVRIKLIKGFFIARRHLR